MTGPLHTPERRQRKLPSPATPGRSVPGRQRAAALCLAAVLLAGPALAYVLPQGAIMRRMVAARDDVGLVTLRVEGTLTLTGDAQRAAAPALGLATDRPEGQAEATLSVKVPGRCRLEATGPAGGAGVSAVSNGGRRRTAGVDLPALSRGLAQVCALLGQRSGSDQEGRAVLESHLRAQGVEPRFTSLARIGGRVAYVLGARGEGAAQLWVYKDSFQPARMRWKEKDGTQWDVWLLDYASPATGESFPRLVEVYQNGQRQVRFNALRGDTRARLDDALFAVQ
jgi:hypothetical protein